MNCHFGRWYMRPIQIKMTQMRPSHNLPHYAGFYG